MTYPRIFLNISINIHRFSKHIAFSIKREVSGVSKRLVDWMRRRIQQLGIAIFILGVLGLVSPVVWPFFQEYPEIQAGVALLTGSAALLTLVIQFSGESRDTTSEEDQVKETLEELKQDGPLSKEDLRRLGQAGTLAVYASEEAAETYYQLSREDREDLDKRLRSVRRSSVGDVASRSGNWGTHRSDLDTEYFQYATPKFDVGFTLVEEEPDEAQILEISNEESDTEIGLYIDRIHERPDRSVKA
ncbi:hypothetical protein ACM16X_02420 [Haloarcula japonica]|uniref:hypothetical protein n=1 Tax=Haloarcula japonica TaxID=29282 RepID=UPI0039F6AC66